MPQISSIFAARYAGTCSCGCLLPIAVGDRMRMADGEAYLADHSPRPTQTRVAATSPDAQANDTEWAALPISYRLWLNTYNALAKIRARQNNPTRAFTPRPGSATDAEETKALWEGFPEDLLAATDAANNELTAMGVTEAYAVWTSDFEMVPLYFPWVLSVRKQDLTTPLELGDYQAYLMGMGLPLIAPRAVRSNRTRSAARTPEQEAADAPFQSRLARARGLTGQDNDTTGGE